MAYESVFDESKRKLLSDWSMDKYMQDPVKWDALVNQISKLPAAGVHSMQRDGRLDIASYRIYGTPQLDWILMIYNGLMRVGSDEPKQLTKSLNLTLAGGESNIFDDSLKHGELVFSWDDPDDDPDTGPQAVPIYTNGTGDYVVLNGGIDPEIYIIYNSNGSVTISNVSAIQYTFVISYIERVTDDALMTGQQLLYPDYESTLKLVKKSNVSTQQSKYAGFTRL